MKELLPTSDRAESNPVMNRAAASQGGSSDAVYRMVARTIARRHHGSGTLLDVGCGSGALWSYVKSMFGQYLGADVIRYDNFPSEGLFAGTDFDTATIPLNDDIADVVAAVETIEHLENPRALFRELRRLAKPGGLIIVTTPNQLSLLSLLTLITKGVFNAFQEAPGLYPSHLTALLEIDLRRIANECGLREIAIAYSNSGRMPLTRHPWPASLGFGGRRFSDNILLSGRVGD